MNYFIRRVLVGVCIALVMMCVHKFARADTWQGNGGSSSSVQGAADAACMSLYGFLGTIVANNFVVTDADNQRFYCISSEGRQFTDWLYIHRTAISTPPPKSCTADGIGGNPLPGSHHDVLYAGSGKTAGWPGGAAGGKINGCNIQIDQLDDDCKSYPAAGGGLNWYCGVGYHFTGDGSYKEDTPGPTSPVPAVPTGDPSATNQPLQAPSPSNDGSCPPGTMNIGTDSTGTAMCKGSGVGSSPTTQKTDTLPPVNTPNPDGSTTTTNSTKTTNADGSTTTNTIACTPTSGGGTSCVSSSNTSNNAAGAPGKSDGTGKGGSASADDMCTKHPELNVCSNSQIASDSCNGAVSNLAFDGDAIQGTILKKMADQQCSNAQNTKEMQLGNLLMAGRDPLAATLPSKDTATQISLNGLDQSAFLGGGGSSCLNDTNVSVMGRMIAIPFSTVCPYLLPLRYAMMVVGGLVSLAIMRKAILGG